jgi:pyridoxamine 5'-phosphate oxidase
MMKDDRDEWPGLSRSDLDLDENPVLQFKYWLQEAQLADISADAMTLATVDPDNRPSQRMVLLKHFDGAGFVFYTNLESRKASDIARNAAVSLHFAWLELQRQVIINGRAEKLSAAEAWNYFSTRPLDSQLATWASRQSQPVPSREYLERQFLAMKEKFSGGPVPLPSFWGGFRVRPETIEFWQGRQHRLHDRFQYRRLTEDGWIIERLSP